MAEKLAGEVWHTHDIYEGAGGNVYHAHAEGRAAHVHDWDEARPIGERRDTFFREAERPKKEDQFPHPS